MAKIIVENCILDKINEKYNWKCQSLDDVKINMKKTIEEASEINELIDNIKVCDIAVGSGHFLISVLNRIIYIKKYLNVLFKYNKKELLTEYDIDIDDDTLRITDGQGHLFKYDKMNALLQTIQETLFNEKKKIIENSIYGVDINTKAIAICQLRLWIELLKNVYYVNDKMQILPNIDINLKSGNSLVNRIRYKVNDTAKLTDINYSKIKKDVKAYKELVKEYINSSSKNTKKEVEQKIKEIKNEILKNEVISEYKLLTTNNEAVLYNEKEDNNLYKNTFEWAIEFPKLLDEEGKFVGFDCIIGNPPYATLNKKQNQKVGIEISNSILDYYKKNPLYQSALGGVLNIYRLFMCRSIDLLKEGGYNCLIVPMSFLCDEGTRELRYNYCQSTNIRRIDIFPEKDNVNRRIFKEAKVSVCIVLNKKIKGTSVIPLRVFLDNVINDNKDYINIEFDGLKFINSDLKLPLLYNTIEYELYKRISNNKRLKEYSKCYVGEIDLTNCKKFITTNPNDDLMLRGAQVQKFRITNNISQGDILYLKGKEFRKTIKESNNKLDHYERRRIVMQGITGVNEKNRLVMTMCPPNYYLGNSVNYLVTTTEKDVDYYLLGLLNSELLNWYFKKISTNNNVNGVDVDTLPIKEGTDEQIRNIIKIVKDLLNKFDEQKVKEMNDIIYDIYDVSDDEKMVVAI